MEVQSWNKELTLANAQFKRLFNNISIESNGKRVKFLCVLGNRSRIFKHLENPEKNSMYKLPMIIIQRTGIQKNNERLANVNNEVKYATHSTRLDYNLYTPVPIDITYEVTIVSKYQEHIDRAISNFIPFFNKDLYVRCQHPKFNDLFFTNQIVMDDGIQEEHPDEIDPSADDVIQATCNFTFKTYMFCCNKKVNAYEANRHGDIISVDEDTGLSTVVEESNEFIPQINQLYVGFYPIPLLSQYVPHMNWVDQIPQDVISVGYTTSAEYYPYVDYFSWKIDETELTDY